MWISPQYKKFKKNDSHVWKLEEWGCPPWDGEDLGGGVFKFWMIIDLEMPSRIQESVK